MLEFVKDAPINSLAIALGAGFIWGGGATTRAGLALLRHPRSAAIDQVLDRLENDPDPKVSGGIRARRHGGGSVP